MFADRADAARQLAEALSSYRGRNPLVLAIPRGAVPMGRILAEQLHGELDVVLVRKLPAPGQPELAIGAIDESGWAYVAPYAHSFADDDYIERVKERQLGELRRRRELFTPGRGPAELTGRTVIVVDDGLATGATMLAALHAVRGRGAAQVVCAVPVASPESLGLVRSSCDEVVCLDAPVMFHAVGQFYREFPQVDDSEVVRLLREARAPSAARTRHVG
jgi:hypothetical protein